MLILTYLVYLRQLQTVDQSFPFTERTTLIKVKKKMGWFLCFNDNQQLLHFLLDFICTNNNNNNNNNNWFCPNSFILYRDNVQHETGSAIVGWIKMVENNQNIVKNRRVMSEKQRLLFLLLLFFLVSFIGFFFVNPDEQIGFTQLIGRVDGLHLGGEKKGVLESAWLEKSHITEKKKENK